MNLLDIGNNVRNYLRQGALNLGFKPLKDNSLGANLRGIGQAGQISTNFAQKQVNNFAQPAYNIPIAGGVLKGIVNQPFNYTSSGAQFLQNPNIKTGSSFLGQGINTATMFVAPTGLSFKAGQRVMPQIPSMAKNSFLKIGLPSGAGGALDTYGKGGNAGDIATSFALNTAMGSGAGIGFPLAGIGIKNTFNALRPSPKPILMPRNNPLTTNLGIKDRPLEVNPNLPARNYTTKPTPKKLMEPDDIYLLDELFNKDIRKEIGKDTTTNQLSQLMNRYFTKAEIDRIPKTDNAWRKALAKRANQTEDYFDNKAKNTNQSFLKISNPKLDPLAQEAKKYKSAEEFVKAKINAYHGTSAKSKILKEGFKPTPSKREGFLGATREVTSPSIYFTDNPSIANTFAKNRVEVLGGQADVLPASIQTKNQLNLTGNVKTQKIVDVFKKAGIDLYDYFGLRNYDIVNGRKPSNIDFTAQRLWTLLDDPKTIEGLKAQGFDSALVQEATGMGKSTAIFDPSLIRTEQQLTDIYNQATEFTDIWNKANKPDKYLYHGTNETVLESISNEGLKPGMRGQLSLSKDEAYARNFARDGMTPQGKTNAVMFRVKEGLLKGKTITSDNPNRPMSDQLHEVLTKEAIPPESLEVMRNGKWQPLIDILNKANKPKTEQSFLKIVNPADKQRGFVSSVKESKNVTKPTKNITIGGYTQKTNDSLMGEAKSLLNEGAEIDFSKVKNVDQKVAATIQEALNLDKAGQHNEAAALFNNLAKYGTELGRGVQAFNMLDKMSPEAITKSAARTIQKYNETATRKIPELTGSQQKLISGAVEKIRGMKDGREKNLAINDLQNTINSFVPSTLVDKAITVWKAGLLTSLRTHERNLLGNTVMQVSEAAKNPIAAGADAFMSTFTGQRTKTATTRGLTQAFSKQTGQQVIDKARLGFDPSNDMAAFDVRKVNWNTKNPVEAVLKKYTNAVFNTLSASDTPFFNASYANSLYDQAGAIAKNSGKSGDKKFIESLVKNPTAEMLTQATKDAQYATFKDKNVLSGVAGNIKRKLAEQGGLKGEAGKIIGELTMPFTGVPSSVIAKTVAYSPLGLIKGAVTTGRVIAGQVPELQRQASEEIARGVLGTGLFGLGSYLMSKGLMTGQPKDSKEADQWAIEGKQANSILIGGKWRGINSVGPQSLVMLAGSKYNEEMNDPEGGFGKFATKLGKDQLGQTFVQGMSAPINALTDPNRYGKSYVGNTVSSVVPNIVKDIAKSQDQYARETNTTVDYLKQSTPLLRNTLLPRRTNIGDVIPQEPTGAGAFLDIFNSKTPIKNKVVDELARLNNVGFEATPSKMKKDQTIQGVKKTLTPQELDTLEAQTGPVLNETLNRLVESEYYKNLDDEAKSKAIDKIVTDIRRKVKGSINLSANTLGDINTEITQTKASTVGQYEILNPETNKIKTIDIETPIEKPILTGNTALDKKLISKFNSKLTSRANDIVALYEDGQIDGKTAESELTKLTTLKLSTGKSKKGKKGKKITIKKIAGARKITNIKIGKSSSLKPIKIKKLKLKSAKKIKKVGNIKIANYKLPKIKIS